MNEGELSAGLARTPSYRYAAVVGDRLLIAGQVPHDSGANLVGVGDPKSQARQCLHNLSTLITYHGFATADIRQLTVYVVGERKSLSAAWEVVTEWFEGDVPPATLLGVALLGHDGQLVEIDATIIRR